MRLESGEHISVKHDNLREAPALINLPQRYLFMAAAQMGDMKQLVRLLETGQYDMNALMELPDNEGKQSQTTALCEAIKNNQQAAARLLLDRGANPSLADSTGVTPLMGAAGMGFAPLVQLLLDAKADMGAVDKDGDSAFHVHYACMNNQPECVEFLVLNWCDKSLRNTDGKTGRDLAAGNENRGVLIMLQRLSRTEPQRKLVAAAEGGDTTELSRLVDGGGDIDARIRT